MANVYEEAKKKIDGLSEDAVKKVISFIEKERKMALVEQLAGIGVGDGAITSYEQLRSERGRQI